MGFSQGNHILTAGNIYQSNLTNLA